jgi:hypothetical protein
MNFGRLAAGAIVAWVVSMGIGFLVNGVLLAGAYAAEAAAFRPQTDMNLAVGFASTLLGFFVFAYAYAKGYEGTSGVQEGLRYGVIVALLVICFGIVWEYVVFPISARLLTYMIVDTLVEFAIYGSIVGAIYRPAVSARTGARRA